MGPENFSKSPACAPSILITFINMVLFKDAVALEHCDTVYMFAGQVIIFDIHLLLNLYLFRLFQFSKLLLFI